MARWMQGILALETTVFQAHQNLRETSKKQSSVTALYVTAWTMIQNDSNLSGRATTLQSVQMQVKQSISMGQYKLTMF